MTSNDVEAAIAAAQAGAEVLRARYGTLLERHGKIGDDFATNADIEAEKAVRAVLAERLPDDGFVGEELGAFGDAERTWLVDPLCGTRNFAAQTPLVAVNVALRAGTGLTVAAAADPFSGEVFFTDGAASWSRTGSQDTALVPTCISKLVDLNVDPPTGEGETLMTVRMLGTPAFTRRFGPRIVSSSLALTWVAAGRRAAYVTDAHSSTQDSVHFAAGIALCQAAGCVVTGLWGQPLDTGAGGLIAAADADTHAALVRIAHEIEPVLAGGQ